MNLNAVTAHRFFKLTLAALIATVCGLALWHTSAGQSLIDASYDYLFRFGARAVSNNVVLIVMDNEAHKELSQTRGQWKRSQHTNLVERLAAD